MDNDAKLDELIAAAQASGLTIDLLQALTHDLDCQAFRKVMGNASSLPSYMKSSGSRYFCRNCSAPSSDNR